MLTRKEIFDYLNRVLTEELDVNPKCVRLDAHLVEDLDFSELDLAEFLLEIEDRFRIKISDKDAQKLTTVGEAVDYIYKRQLTG